MNADFRIRVSHRRLWGGLLLIAAAAGAMALAVELPSSGLWLTLAEILVMVGSAAAMITGAVLMFGAVFEACATCGTAVVAATTQLEAAEYEALMRDLASDAPLRLGAREEVTVVAASQAGAAIEYTMCPRCRGAGRLFPCRLRWNERAARLESYELGEPIMASSWRMAQFLRITRAAAPRT
ncbi:MAG: hypothetical protein IT370_13530 [Deltaproteobacteria bacterium]|nr:hypothetical protein [Deltaproteobacteria bacterium]